MITTLTLNPALDKTLIIEDFAVDKVNKIKEIKINAGGKGINASRVICALGERTTALGFLGGNTGKEIHNMLKNLNIQTDFTKISGNTRINSKIIDIKNNTCTDVNETGNIISKEELEELMIILKNYQDKADILILAGSVPNGINDTIYKKIIESVDKTKTKVILDASGGLLKEGIKAKPWLIKPNIQELSELLQKPLNSEEEVILEAKKIVALGITYVCVSMGEKGLLLVGSDVTLHALPPKVVAKNTVGAGDSVVGSLAVSFLRKENIKEAIKKACAISAASVTLDSTDIPSIQDINKFYQEVQLIDKTK